MPVQVLPYVPTFGESLLPRLAEAGTSIGKAIQERRAMEGFKKLLEPQQPQSSISGILGQQGVLPNAGTPGMSPIEQMFSKEGGLNLGDVTTITQAAKAAGLNEKVVSDYLLNQQKLAAKQSFEIGKEGRARAEKYVDKVSNERNALPDLETSLVRIEDALSSKDLKGIQNWIADKTGDDYLRTSSSAALNSAVKEFLLADLGRIKGGRPNQFLEKQLSDSYPKAGYDPKANDKIFLAMQSGVDIRRKEVEISDRIKEKFDERGLPLPSNFENLVYKELRPYVESKEKELMAEYKQINAGKGRADKEFKSKAPEGNTPVISPDGERGYIPLDQLENALKQGYKAA